MSYLNSRVANQTSKLDASYAEFLSPSKISFNEANWQTNLRNKKIEKDKTNIQFELRKNKIKNSADRRINSTGPKLVPKQRTRIFSPLVSSKKFSISEQNDFKPTNTNLVTKDEEAPAVVSEEVFEFSTIEDTSEKVKENKSGETVYYKYFKLCDCCAGKFGNKLNPCKMIQDVYYTPLWFQFLVACSCIGFFSVTIYLAIIYTNNKNLLSYTNACTSTSQCNIDKNLYCRLNNVSDTDSCNCPAPSKISTCDCASTFYWNGIICTKVYSYGQGPCIGDYSCSSGLTCNQFTSLCTCPYIKPIWSNETNSCNYDYKGCFYNCLSSISCDFFQNNVIVATPNNTGIYSIELDDCLNLCKSSGYTYGHMEFSGNIYRCACSFTYNTYSTKMPDADCNTPCSLYKSSVSRCPKDFRYSSFYIS